MGATSAKSKNNWTNRHYDRIALLVKKGEKEKLQEIARAEGISVARLFSNCINACYPGTLEERNGVLPSMRPRPLADAQAPSEEPGESFPMGENEAAEEPTEGNSEDSAQMKSEP